MYVAGSDIHRGASILRDDGLGIVNSYLEVETSPVASLRFAQALPAELMTIGYESVAAHGASSLPGRNSADGLCAARAATSRRQAAWEAGWQRDDWPCCHTRAKHTRSAAEDRRKPAFALEVLLGSFDHRRFLRFAILSAASLEDPFRHHFKDAVLGGPGQDSCPPWASNAAARRA